MQGSAQTVSQKRIESGDETAPAHVRPLHCERQAAIHCHISERLIDLEGGHVVEKCAHLRLDAKIEQV